MEAPPSTVSIPMSFVFAFLCLVLASYFRYVSLRGKKSWDKAWDQVDPSLKAGPSPATMMSRGCTGLVTWLIGWGLLVGCLVAALDFVFNGGQFTASVIANVVSSFD